jgi:hypothetical protein
MRLCEKIIVHVTMYVLMTTVSHAQDASTDTWTALLGKRAPVSVTTPASGPWAAKYPFNPQQFGLIRGFSPGTAAKTDCILIYTRSLSPAVLSLAKRIEAIISETPSLESSFVHLFDEKGAQRGGYTADEVVARIGEIQTLANKHQLTRLSIGIAANSSGKNVGLVGDRDLVVVLLAASKEQGKAANVAWYRSLNTIELGENALNSLDESLRAAVTKQSRPNQAVNPSGGSGGF